MRRGSPTRAMSSSFHWPVRGSSSAVVEAFVDSATGRPVSQEAHEVGDEQEALRLGEPLGASAASWKTVLNGRCCSPEAA